MSKFNSRFLPSFELLFIEFLAIILHYLKIGSSILSIFFALQWLVKSIENGGRAILILDL